MKNQEPCSKENDSKQAKNLIHKMVKFWMVAHADKRLNETKHAKK